MVIQCYIEDGYEGLARCLLVQVFVSQKLNMEKEKQPSCDGCFSWGDVLAQR